MNKHFLKLYFKIYWNVQNHAVPIGFQLHKWNNKINIGQILVVLSFLQYLKFSRFVVIFRKRLWTENIKIYFSTIEQIINKGVWDRQVPYFRIFLIARHRMSWVTAGHYCPLSHVVSDSGSLLPAVACREWQRVTIARYRMSWVTAGHYCPPSHVVSDSGSLPRIFCRHSTVIDNFEKYYIIILIPFYIPYCLYCTTHSSFKINVKYKNKQMLLCEGFNC